MDTINDEVSPFLNELKQEHLATLRTELNIKSSAEYIDKIYNDDRNKKEVVDYVNRAEIRLEAFYQQLPLINQDIVVASLNPGTGDLRKYKFKEGGPNHERHKAGDDLEELTWVTAKDFKNWALKEKSAFDSILRKLRNNISILPNTSVSKNKEYIQVENRGDLQDSYFADIYHTRYMKLQSPDKTFVHDKFAKKDENKDYWRNMFAQEISHVNPKLILCGCRDVWRSIQDHLVEDDSEDIKLCNNSASNNSVVNDKYNKGENSACGGVFRVNPKFDSMENTVWLVTHFHPSHGPNLSKLEENLEFVSGKIAW